MTLPHVAYQKIAVIGHARHGKDTVCEMLRDRYGFEFTSSSLFCAERVVFPRYRAWCMGGQDVIFERHIGWPKDDPGWITADDCFNDRSNHRALWFDLIADYCKPDAARLARDILEKHDVYAGIRSTREFHAAVNEGIFDLVLWVDRSKHLPKEPKTSMELQPWMADFVIDNNGSLDDLEREVDRLVAHRLSVKNLAEGLR